MQSSTGTPHSLLPSTLPAGPWRAWSIPLDRTYVRRKVCGLLNKVTAANLDRISDRFAELTVAMGRSGDSTAVDACAQMLVQRCTADPSRIGLIARLVQKAVDEAEGEGLRWRSVDAYYFEDPSTSLALAVRITLLVELGAALHRGGKHDACSLSTLAGELLVLGVLSSDDVEDVLGLLFRKTAENSEGRCVVLCRMLSPILVSTEASHLIDSMALIERIESVLKEDTILPKIRYMLMNVLDQCLYPRPRNVFNSDLHRSEAHEFHDRINEGSLGPPTPLPPSGLSKAIEEKCLRYAQTLLATRNVAGAGPFLQTLPSAGRCLLVTKLISAAMSSGDDGDVGTVVSFLSLPFFRRAPHAHEDLLKSFEAEITMLEDTVLDVPSAYRTMAALLHAAEIPKDAIEDLASHIIVRQNAARDRLLEEVALLDVSADDLLDHYDVTGGASGEEGSPAPEYAYAY